MRKKYNTEEERKAARKASQKRYRKKHKDEIAVKKAEYRAKHKDEEGFKASQKARNKRYRAKHKDEIAAKQAEYRANHKEEKAEYNAKYFSTPFGRAYNLVSTYHLNDKKYNRGECTIDAQWIVDNVFSGQVCHYCGETDWHKLGCDRIDNTKPHTPDNVVCCCGECNIKKNITPYDEFMRMIGKIKSGGSPTS